MKNNNRFIGFVFILLGLFYLGGLLGYIPVIGSWSALVLVGSIIISIISFTSRNFIGGFFFLGIFFDKILEMFPEYFGYVSLSFWNIMIIAILLGVGMQLLFRGKSRRYSQDYHYHYSRENDNYGYRGYQQSEQNVRDESDDVIDGEYAEMHDGYQQGYTHGRPYQEQFDSESDQVFIENTFREVNRYVTSQNFKGGEINCSFGKVSLHLTQAQLDQHGAHLALYCSFGSLTVYVPRGWAVNNKVNATIFSDVSDDRLGILDPLIPNLTLTGNVNFGDIKILYV